MQYMMRVRFGPLISEAVCQTEVEAAAIGQALVGPGRIVETRKGGSVDGWKLAPMLRDRNGNPACRLNARGEFCEHMRYASAADIVGA